MVLHEAIIQLLGKLIEISFVGKQYENIIRIKQSVRRWVLDIPWYSVHNKKKKSCEKAAPCQTLIETQNRSGSW